MEPRSTCEAPPCVAKAAWRKLLLDFYPMDASLIPSDDDEEEPRKDDSMIPSDDEYDDYDVDSNVYTTDSGETVLARAPKRQCTLNAYLGIPEPVAPPVPKGGYLVVDLFCSIGGVSFGAAFEGHTVVMGVDSDEQRLAVHRCNFPNATQHCLLLGPETEEELVAKIREVVPADQWHRLWVHCSPPCQAQSLLCAIAPNANHEQHADKAKRKAEGVNLVRWSLELVVGKLCAPQFSLEEVDDRESEVSDAVSDAMREHRGCIDFDTFDMADFGAPQHRNRLIAARPATIRALRFSHALRLPSHVPRVSIRDALGPQRIPGTAVYYQGPKTAHPIPGKAKRCPKTPGKWTDGRVQWFELWRPAPAVAGQLARWLDADFEAIKGTDEGQNVANLSAEDIGILMTFPAGSVQWPENVKRTAQLAGYGNAVCPLFARKLFRAASTNV